MRAFMVRRLFFVVLSLFGASVVMFSLSRMAHDPRELFVPQGGYGITKQQWESLGERMGFNKPVVVQYFLWVGRMLRGDMGESLSQQVPVRGLIAKRMSATVQLSVGGWLVALALGVPLGVLSAVKRGTLLDMLGRWIAVFGQALPPFWVGIMLIFLFAVVLGWLPPGEKGQGISIRHFILPSITLGWAPAAGILRLTRSAMLEILDSEYVKFARAKGVREWMVIWKHALKNALIPPLTAALLLMAGFLHGALVVEYVFAWPGVGRLALYRAVWDNDFPLLLGGVFVFVVIYLAFSLAADVAYAFIDPRIRYR